jgi:hypothetical protein
MPKKRRIKKQSYHSDSEDDDADVFEASQQWVAAQQQQNSTAKSKISQHDDDNNDNNNDESAAPVNHFAHALQSALHQPIPKRAAHVFDRAALAAAGKLRQHDAEGEEEEEASGEQIRKRKRAGQHAAGVVVDAILAGTRTTEQRTATRMAHQMSRDQSRQRRQLLLNQFHDPSPLFNEHEKRLSRLASQGGKHCFVVIFVFCFVLVCRVVTANHVSLSRHLRFSVVQLFNALKRQRKQWKEQKAGAILTKEKQGEPVALCAGRFGATHEAHGTHTRVV